MKCPLCSHNSAMHSHRPLGEQWSASNRKCNDCMKCTKAEPADEVEK